jgi:transcriptional regulator with XRE-family HTH domain
VKKSARTPAKKKKENSMKGFGHRLKKLREENGLSQQELADMIGIHLSQLSRIEREASVPSAETLVELARALRTSTDTLLTGESNDEPAAPIRNVRLLERFQQLETIDRDEQETAIKIIDALIAKHRVEEALGRSAKR